jgi:hypothetical protein
MRTRGDLIFQLNPIQFQILLQKCQLDPSQRRASSAFNGIQPKNSTGTDFETENDLNQNLIFSMWNDSMPASLKPQLFDPHAFLFNESDVFHFMSEQTNSSDADTNSTSTGGSGTPLIFPGT